MRFALAVFLSLMASVAFAQQIYQPFAYPVTLGTASVQVIGQNLARKSLTFHNPNDQIKVAVCPVFRRDTGGSQVATINGAGCVTLLPYDRWLVTNNAPAGSGQSVIGSAWIGVASSGGAALTIIESE